MDKESSQVPGLQVAQKNSLQVAQVAKKKAEDTFAERLATVARGARVPKTIVAIHTNGTAERSHESDLLACELLEPINFRKDRKKDDKASTTVVARATKHHQEASTQNTAESDRREVLEKIEKNCEWPTALSCVEFGLGLEFKGNTMRVKSEHYHKPRTDLVENEDYFMSEESLKTYTYQKYGWRGPRGKEFSPFRDGRRSTSHHRQEFSSPFPKGIIYATQGSLLTPSRTMDITEPLYDVVPFDETPGGKVNSVQTIGKRDNWGGKGGALHVLRQHLNLEYKKLDGEYIHIMRDYKDYKKPLIKTSLVEKRDYFTSSNDDHALKVFAHENFGWIGPDAAFELPSRERLRSKSTAKGATQLCPLPRGRKPEPTNKNLKMKVKAVFDKRKHVELSQSIHLEPRKKSRTTKKKLSAVDEAEAGYMKSTLILIPIKVKAEFNQVGFAKFEDEYHPMIQISPFEIPMSPKRSEWESMFKKVSIDFVITITNSTKRACCKLIIHIFYESRLLHSGMMRGNMEI